MKERTKADFRALREMTGIMQTDIAHDLHVQQVTVRRWERADVSWGIPDDAWDYVLKARKKQLKVADDAMETAESAAKQTGVKSVTLPIWRTSEEYESANAGNGHEFRRVNAINKLVAELLTERGFSIHWVFGGSDEWKKISSESKKNRHEVK